MANSCNTLSVENELDRVWKIERFTNKYDSRTFYDGPGDELLTLDLNKNLGLFPGISDDVGIYMDIHLTRQKKMHSLEVTGGNDLYEGVYNVAIEKFDSEPILKLESDKVVFVCKKWIF